MSFFMHSPTRKGASIGSQSHPDLSNMQSSEDIPQITYRKRKTPDDDYLHQLSVFKDEIKEMLITFNNSQKENMQTINQNISSINSQLAEIKLTTESLVLENNILKTEIAQLKSSKTTTDEKIKVMESDLKQLKSISEILPPSQTSITTHGDIVTEVQERLARDKNIIITGIPEINSTNVEERREHDRTEVMKITESFFPGEPTPKVTNLFRLGKYKADTSRPVKVCFENPQIVKVMLRKKTQNDNIKIYSDQTKCQKEYLNNLREELKKRTDDGETDLTIKYIKGVPKIIKETAKNDKQQ